MPAIPRAVGSREALPSPGNIVVTPVPVDPPIHSRPVLQSSHSHHPVQYTFPHAGAPPPSPTDKISWPLVILFVLLACGLGVVLSNWGWKKVTGKIWKWSSHWEGTIDDDMGEELLEHPYMNKSAATINIEEIYPPTEDLEWVSRRESE